MPDLITVRIEGREVRVRAGTTVAAVLLQGSLVFRTSVSGEPRAALCGMGICMECRVTIDGAPQQRACQMLCRDGMEVSRDA